LKFCEIIEKFKGCSSFWLVFSSFKCKFAFCGHATLADYIFFHVDLQLMQIRKEKKVTMREKERLGIKKEKGDK
jgi:hypothetical protein